MLEGIRVKIEITKPDEEQAHIPTLLDVKTMSAGHLQWTLDYSLCVSRLCVFGDRISDYKPSGTYDELYLVF